MATFNYSAFGLTYRDVMRQFGPRTFNIQDVASILRTVGSGSTTTIIVLDSVDGLTVGDDININTGTFPEDGETRTISEIDTDNITVTVSAAFSSAPVSGDILNDGPERVETYMLEAETEVVSIIPDKYRNLLSRVEGEAIVRRATSGQTTATLCDVKTPFMTAPTGIKLYRDYGGAWYDRTESDEMNLTADYTVDGVTVTFVGGLSEGTNVLAEYDHSLSAPPQLLKEALKAFAAYRVGKIMHMDHEAGEVAWLLDNVARCDAQLRGLSGVVQSGQGGNSVDTTPRGIAEFDDLVLLNDWKRENVGGIRVGRIDLQ